MFCDMAEHIQLVKRADEKRLMQHRCDHRVGHMMPRYIEKDDPSHSPAPLQVFHNVVPPLRVSALNPGLQIVSFLKINIDDMVAASRFVYGQCLAVNINSVEH